MNEPKKTLDNTLPKVFQIGHSLSGELLLAQLFRKNGYGVAQWESGRIAEDMAYSKAAGELPLQKWQGKTCFCRMESTHIPSKPLIEAFKEYRFLQQCFPGAVFIYNFRNVEDWIIRKSHHQMGKHAQKWAHLLNVELPELPDIWRENWQSHHAEVLDFFKTSDRFFRFDFDAPDIESLAEFLRQWFTIDKLPNANSAAVLPATGEKRKLAAPLVKSAKPVVEKADSEFAQRVAKYCLGNLNRNNPAGAPRNFSGNYAEWDGEQKVIGRDGNPLPMAIGDDGQFHGNPDVGNLYRVSHTLNEIQALGIRGNLRFDMQDAREFGQPGISDVKNPIIVYTRRPDTVNMVLWPLPGYHSLGLWQFAHKQPFDKIPFDDKIDMACWRGSLNGKILSELASEIEVRRFSGPIIESLTQAENDADLEKIQQELMGLSRYNLVARSLFSENIDAKISLDEKLRKVKKHRQIQPFYGPRVAHSWFLKHKYILSISGYDTGSNFFLGANSNSLVLKEEDGWELFYTAEFQPWVHYIPLDKGALDVEEKVEWAKGNPRKCKEMIRAANEVCAKFANRQTRREMLSIILEHLCKPPRKSA